MNRAKGRAGWALSAAASLGLTVAPVAATTPSGDHPPSAEPSGAVAPLAATARTDRLAEIRVELALLADNLTFPYPLGARVAGAVLEVGGIVPDVVVRDHALRLAREASGMEVVDKMVVRPHPAPPAVPTPNDVLCRQAIQTLAKAFPQHTSKFQVEASALGQIVVRGSVPSLEEKLAVSRRLSRLEGCTSVDNQLVVRKVARHGKVYVVLSADGEQLLPDELVSRPMAPAPTWPTPEPTLPPAPLPVPARPEPPAVVRVVPSAPSPTVQPMTLTGQMRPATLEAKPPMPPAGTVALETRPLPPPNPTDVSRSVLPSAVGKAPGPTPPPPSSAATDTRALPTQPTSPYGVLRTVPPSGPIIVNGPRPTPPSASTAAKPMPASPYGVVRQPPTAIASPPTKPAGQQRAAGGPATSVAADRPTTATTTPASAPGPVIMNGPGPQREPAVTLSPAVTALSRALPVTDQHPLLVTRPETGPITGSSIQKVASESAESTSETGLSATRIPVSASTTGPVIHTTACQWPTAEAPSPTNPVSTRQPNATSAPAAGPSRPSSPSLASRPTTATAPTPRSPISSAGTPPATVTPVAYQPAPPPAVPPTQSNQTARLQTMLAQRIETVCGGAARNVEVHLCSANSLYIRVHAPNAAVGQQLGARILKMPELKPYQVSLEVKLTE